MYVPITVTIFFSYYSLYSVYLGYPILIIHKANEEYPGKPKIFTYDICLTEQTIKTYKPSLAENVIFAVPEMHCSQRHQFQCQFKFHPIYKPGIGRFNGENIETIHSTLNFLVGSLKCVCILQTQIH